MVETAKPNQGKPLWARWLHATVHISAFVALAALVVEFGFHLGERDLDRLHGVQLAVTGLLTVDAIARLLLSSNRRAHVASHRAECALATLFVFGLIAGAVLDLRGEGLRLIVYAAQIYLVAVAGLGLASANEWLLSTRVRPEMLLVGSFLILIGVGTGLLMLPACRAPQAALWSWSDALFTSTSAVCVTGLTVRDAGSELSFRGQAALLALIQIGGLGLVSIAATISVLQRSSTRIRELGALHELLGVENLGTLRRFLGYVVAITLCTEIAGAALLLHAREGWSAYSAGNVWWSVFHSVSAFCNAGFGLEAANLSAYASAPSIVLPIAALIVVGGLGYPVWTDLLRYRIAGLPLLRRVRLRWSGALGGEIAKLSLHTRLTLTTVTVLILGGALLFWIAERGRTLGALEPLDRGLNALFQSITARTAGFNTVDIAGLGISASMLVIVLMAIGASPASTGGGVKTTAVAVIFHTIRSMVRNREHVEVYGRTISRRAVNAAVAVSTLYALTALVLSTVLLATHPGLDPLAVLFETVSALSTVGLSAGVTTKVDTLGRLVLCLAMLIGRVGPIALLWTLFSRRPAAHYQYPSEKLLVT